MLPDVVIIGAGILGVSTAFYLSALGKTAILVIDRKCLSAGATGRSGALVRSNYDNRDDARLALMSLGVFRAWRDQVGGESHFRPVGLLDLADGASRDAHLALIERQRQWGVDIQIIDSVEAKGLARRLRLDHTSDSIAYEAGAGCCDANMANRSMHDAARARGVEFIFDEPVMSIIAESGRITAIKTARRTVATRAVVLAAGVWTNQLLLPLGIDFGLTPRLSRIAVFRPPELDEDERLPTILDGIQNAWFRPLPSGCILVGAERGCRSVDPDRIPNTAPHRLIESYRGILAHRLAVSPHAAPRGAWAGAYMMSPDCRPIVGESRQIANLFFACGDSGTSFKIAPAIGLGLAEQILFGEARSVELASLSPDRFGGPQAQPSGRSVAAEGSARNVVGPAARHSSLEPSTIAGNFGGAT